jgi:hypothetical protein
VTPQAGEILSNLKRVTTSYDEEMRSPDGPLAPTYDRAPSAETQDETDRIYEENYAGAASQRWHNQERFMGRENEEARLVNILHPHSFIRKLRRAGVDARIEAPHFYVWDIDHKTGKPTQIKKERTEGRLWLHDDAVNGLLGISAWITNSKTGLRERKCVTSLQHPCGPEWSLMYFDEFDVPIKERYRGWRTSLLNLILRDVISEAEAVDAFGPVPLSDVSLVYRKTLYAHRMKKGGHTQ